VAQISWNLEALFIEYPSHIEQHVKAKGTKKVKPTKKKQRLVTKNVNASNVHLTTPLWILEAKKTTTYPCNEYKKQKKT
jgi:hypothetical protein